MAKPQDDRPSELGARLTGFDDPATLLESLFTASPVAYQIFDVDGQCRLVNDAFLGLFGGAPAPDYNILTDETAAANGNRELIHRAFAGERITLPPFRHDPRELHAAFATPGRPLTLVASFFPLRGADGRVIFVGIAFTDVTPENEARELAEAGQRCAEAAERRQALLSRVSALLSAPLDQGQRPHDLAHLLVPELADLCTVALVDEAGALRRVAEAGCELEEVDAAQRLWVPLWARDRVIGALSLGMRRAPGRSFGAEDEALAREVGERVALGLDNARLFAEAEHARSVAEAERAALHVSEERRRLAVEAAGTGTWDWEPATGRVLWDARTRELLNVDPDVVVDYPLFRTRLHPVDRERVEAVLDAARPGDSIDLEYRVLASDGERWIRSKGQVLGGADGEQTRMIGITQDISDRKYIERELQAAKQRAEAANGAKDEFLAMLGHELRNPLSPILTALHLMRMRHGELMAKEQAVIERQVHHMVRLVDDLLDVSRITRGKVELKRSTIQLAEVVDEALEIAGPLLEKRAHRLALSLPRTGLSVEGDTHRLTQAVANLLTNAARYTDPGGVITVLARAEAGWARLEVRDSGTGIDPELLPRIFDLFVQGRRASDRADGGLGLGLAIVRSLVELHGGTVAATSRGLGLGSEFMLRLPLAASAAAVVGHGLANVCAQAGEHRVLVVDDNRDAAEMLADVLGAAGHRACVAFDGPDALRLAPDFHPELAVLDIGLPVMDGYELGRRLRELPTLADLKLVALTGYGQASDRARSHEAGFDEHLTKPVELPVVEALVRRLLGGP